METITTHEAKTHLSRYLAAVEAGEEFIIARGSKPVAKLVQFIPEPKRRRPKVGETFGPTVKIPDDALAPMTDEELAEWGI
ncbi:type II toxin-antitoxin system prevent-host-death family antitoxin [soil metagenome]